MLVLDDFHEIESPIVQRELQTLLDRSPGSLRVVISTRADPRLRLQRLRLTDDLTEIRAAELAFTMDECGEALEPFAADLADRRRRGAARSDGRLGRGHPSRRAVARVGAGSAPASCAGSPATTAPWPTTC